MSILFFAGRFLSGLSIRAWFIIGAVALFAVWSGYCYTIGYRAADAAWTAKQLEAKIAKLELEIKTQKDADAIEDKLREELADENAQQKKVIDDFLANNEKRTDKCLLGDDAGKLQ